MSADYNAIAFIGCELPLEKMYIVGRTRPSLVCPHHKKYDTDFCPECGGRNWITGKVPIPEWAGKDTFLGLRIVEGTDSMSLFACLQANDITYSNGGAEAAKIPVTGWKIEDIRDTLKNALEPLGLWDDTSFGLWSVLYCSY